jgi:hypothetical protein
MAQPQNHRCAPAFADSTSPDARDRAPQPSIELTAFIDTLGRILAEAWIAERNGKNRSADAESQSNRIMPTGVESLGLPSA